MTTSIKNAVQNDMAALRDLDETFSKEGTPAWALVSEDVFQFKINVETLIVADVDGVLIGYLMWTFFWGFPFIEFIRVEAQHRNKGIGTLMLDNLAAQVSERGHHVIWSSTQSVDALRWHERNGFGKVGSTKWIWGSSDETVLMKELSS